MLAELFDLFGLILIQFCEFVACITHSAQELVELRVNSLCVAVLGSLNEKRHRPDSQCGNTRCIKFSEVCPTSRVNDDDDECVGCPGVDAKLGEPSKSAVGHTPQRERTYRSSVISLQATHAIPWFRRRLKELLAASASLRGTCTLKEAIMATKKKSKVLQDLFLDTLKDIYYAEQKITKALPKMAKAAQANELKEAFEKHLRETQSQVKRLEQVFQLIDEAAKGKKCPAIDGMIKEGDEISKDYKGSPALDAGLLAAAQAVEHYEISRYGTLRTWAQELGLDEAVRLLDATLDEEKTTDANLSKLAESSVNRYAEAA